MSLAHDSEAAASHGSAAYPAEAIEAARRHPAFAGAMAEAARGLVGQYHGERLVNLIASDRGRAHAATLALHLHYSGGARGFTAAELKALVVREGVCSPGRAAALIALMQWGGYLVAETVDGLVRRLVPTERLLALHRERWRVQLSAAGRIFPEFAGAADRLGEPAVLRAFALAQTGRFVSGFRAGLYVPEVMTLAERNAGMVMLFSLLLSDLDPAAPPLSVKGLARRFHVSRPHVTAVLREAAAGGLLASADPASARPLLSPELRAGVERLFALLFLFNASCARSALEGLPPRIA